MERRLASCPFCKREINSTPRGINHHGETCKENIHRIKGKSGYAWKSMTDEQKIEHSKRTSRTNLLRSKDTYRKVSTTIREKVKNGNWHNGSGRAKKQKYKGISFDSNWEVLVAKWLDSTNVIWERPNKGFMYPWKDKESYYFPDFYLPGTNEFLEVKGLPTQRDVIKWKHFPYTLIYMFGEELYELGLIKQFKPGARQWLSSMLDYAPS